MSRRRVPARDQQTFRWCCPVCRSSLFQPTEDVLICPSDRRSFRRNGLIWDFLTAERRAYFERFQREYLCVRHAEGRGSDSEEYYRHLPYSQETGEIGRQWQIRARSYECLMKDCLPRFNPAGDRSLRILDLGAGNGWLSYRLSRLGHRVVAVDLLDDELDGLGACRHYDADFTPIRAEFDALPLEDGQFDLAIFNASLHYSGDYVRTLSSAFRALDSEGAVILMDSPLYRDASSGDQMVTERKTSFQRLYGFTSDSIPSESFLTYGRLDELSIRLGVRWEFLWPNYDWKWRLRPLLARLRQRREPATFALILGRAQEGP